MKSSDALMGLAPNFSIPCTNKFDGKSLTFEASKSFNDVKVGLDTTFTPSSGKLGNVVKVDYACGQYGVTAGLKASVDDIGAAEFHATTDLTKYDISYHMSGASHS